MNTEDQEKEKYLATQKRRIQCAEKDGWTKIRAVYIKYGDASYYNDDDVLELRGISPNGNLDYVPKYPLQRLIANTWDGERSFTIPFLFESKEAAEKMWNSKQEEVEKMGEEAQWRGFRCFGISSCFVGEIKFYTLDEWFANAYSPESDPENNPEKSEP